MIVTYINGRAERGAVLMINEVEKIRLRWNPMEIS